LQIPHDLTPFGIFVLWHVNDDLPACVDRYSARPQNGVRSYKIWEIFPMSFRNAGAIPAIPESDRHTQLNSGAVSSKADDFAAGYGNDCWAREVFESPQILSGSADAQYGIQPIPAWRSD